MKKIIIPILALLLFSGCYSLLEPTVNYQAQGESLRDFSYVYIPSTGVKSSSNTSYIYTTTGAIPYSQQRSVNPSDLISGYFIKKGYVIAPTLDPAIKDRTLIVSYGETGTRPVGILGSYTTEITMQFISGKTSNLICTATAEGIGDTEADDVRQAIKRALDAVFDYNCSTK